MSTVIPIAQRRLREADFCFGERVGDGTFPVEAEAWTKWDIAEVLAPERRTAFLKPLARNAIPGDRLEIFQVTDLDKPESDPLAMASLIVTHFETDRHGRHMRTEFSQPILHFGPNPGEGIQERPWHGKQCVFEDGRRVASFDTLIEAVERAERLRDPKASGDKYGSRVNARLAELRKTTAPGVSLPVSHRCRDEDICMVGFKKVSRVVEVRTLDPIADLLADRQYFCRVASRFRAGDRVTILRFDSDARHRVIEHLHLALADIDAGRLRLFPQMPVAVLGKPETGWILDTIDKRVVLRRDGRAVESFPSRQHADWYLDEHGIRATEFKPRKAA